MKKLAIIFPGVGYTCTKPLLYYTASMAAERGYEIIRLDYGQDIHTFHGRRTGTYHKTGNKKNASPVGKRSFF